MSTAFQIFTQPSQQALDTAANVLSGATLTFSLTGTSTPTNAYSDSALTTPVSNPLSANSAGVFIPVFLDPLVSYRIVLKTQAGSVLQTWDPANENVLAAVTSTYIATTLDSLKRTAAEISAAVTPVNYAYLPGNGLRYGMLGDDSTDNTTALASLCAVAAQGVKCVIPKGIYRYATSPNWAIAGLHLEGERGAILKHTGAGVAFNMDSGGDGVAVYGLNIADLIITGNASTTHAFYSRGMVYSVFRNIEVRSCANHAFHILHGVTNLYSNCFINRSVSGVAFNPVPQIGFYLDENGSGFFTADCTFLKCSAENFDGGTTGDGVDITSGSGNTFIGGTFETLNRGIVIRAGCRHNDFVGIWCEDNVTNDVVDLGQINTFRNLHAASSCSGANVDMAGDGASFFGGYIRHCDLEAGSIDSAFYGVSFDNSVGAGMTGPGTFKRYACMLVDGTLNVASALSDVLGDSTTFTPTLIGSSTAGTQTYVKQVGRYSRFGNLVQFQLFVQISAKGGTIAGNVTIGGLPYPFRNETDMLASLVVGDFSGLTNSAGRTQFMARGNIGASTIAILEGGSGVVSQTVPVTNMAAATAIVISGTYLID